MKKQRGGAPPYVPLSLTCKQYHGTFFDYVTSETSKLENILKSTNSTTELINLFSYDKSQNTIVIPGTNIINKINLILDHCNLRNNPHTDNNIITLINNIINSIQKEITIPPPPPPVPVAPEILDTTRLAKWNEEIKKYDIPTKPNLKTEIQGLDLDPANRSTHFVNLIRHQYELFEIAIQINANLMKLPDKYTMTDVLEYDISTHIADPPFNIEYLNDINTIVDINTIKIKDLELKKENHTKNLLLINKKISYGVFFDSLSRFIIHLKLPYNQYLLKYQTGSTDDTTQTFFWDDYITSFIKANQYSQCLSYDIPDTFKNLILSNSKFLKEIIDLYIKTPIKDLMTQFFIKNKRPSAVSKPNDYYDNYEIVPKIKVNEINLNIKDICYAIQLIYYLEKNEPIPTP
jgi:hypothetical protein